jgi:transposase
MSETFGIPRGSINRWLQWYQADGAEGLRTLKQPGRAPKLTEVQLLELTVLIDGGPMEAGFQTGIWTGPMIGDLIQRRFGVRYHNHHVPRLLHWLGFSVQRPRKKLSKADSKKQERWLRYRLPAIKKSRPVPRDCPLRG